MQTHIQCITIIIAYINTYFVNFGGNFDDFFPRVTAPRLCWVLQAEQEHPTRGGGRVCVLGEVAGNVVWWAGKGKVRRL